MIDQGLSGAAVAGHDDVSRVGFEQPGSEPTGPFPHPERRLVDRAAADLQRARPARARPPGDDGSVGLHEPDRLDRDAQPVGDDHREGRGVALAVG